MSDPPAIGRLPACTNWLTGPVAQRRSVSMAVRWTRASLVPAACRSIALTTLRQREGEGRPLPNLALHPDLAAVQLDELPTQSQSESSALHLLVCRPHLPELLEDRLLILEGDADAGIADRDLDEPVRWHGPDLDPPTCRRELDRIGQ